MRLYEGPLGVGYVTGVVKKAYDSWRGQNERCNNARNKAYRHYGGKGVRVAYTSRQFVAWWLIQAKRFPLHLKLTVNRKDTSGHYCFENIELVPWAVNVAESNARTHIKPVDAYCADTGKLMGSYPSMTHAARVFGCEPQTVGKHCKRRYTPERYSNGACFRYSGDPL